MTNHELFEYVSIRFQEIRDRLDRIEAQVRRPGETLAFKHIPGNPSPCDDFVWVKVLFESGDTEVNQAHNVTWREKTDPKMKILEWEFG
jgi:hypothetical protein